MIISYFLSAIYKWGEGGGDGGGKGGGGVIEFVAAIRCPEDHLKSEKSSFSTEYGRSVS